ncbi:uncharacterized protein BT62DRAFT_933393 [Guyanagaster necrorhizus]|uniref:Uncharacterized protein n=1 Tax=Guyanagaster necrorhizus TaxID=856835 RepID=A0A9P8ARK1_9AGAR|nr:uncharacterized protein BT62DRAFT_933393 [Guyanagaster necrorhizus MCA 3950]KAG7444981.1 hypothetical protein BT62DRAFT_933393 [Guyanagaster necrorhizus MCA 3950]
MGRALFSSIYHSAPAVATPIPFADTPYEKTYENWSIFNQFDPDSDDFFEDAQYEAFITDEQEQEQVSERSDVGSTPALSRESNMEDRGSPMAVGSDDPAAMLADAIESGEWDQSLSEATIEGDADVENDPQWRRVGDFAIWTRPVLASTRFVSDTPAPSLPPFLPPSSLRNSTTASDLDDDEPATPPRRSVTIAPITIPREPSSPSPVTPDGPLTPPDAPFSLSSLAPSPAPTVTPRVYRWTALPSQRDSSGPLTNPSARMSHARIVPAHIRLPTFAV